MAKILKKRLFKVEISGYKKLYVLAHDSKEVEDLVTEHLNEMQEKSGIVDKDGDMVHKEIEKIIAMELIYANVIY